MIPLLPAKNRTFLLPPLWLLVKIVWEIELCRPCSGKWENYAGRNFLLLMTITIVVKPLCRYVNVNYRYLLISSFFKYAGECMRTRISMRLWYLVSFPSTKFINNTFSNYWLTVNKEIEKQSITYFSDIGVVTEQAKMTALSSGAAFSSR